MLYCAGTERKQQLEDIDTFCLKIKAGQYLYQNG